LVVRIEQCIRLHCFFPLDIFRQSLAVCAEALRDCCITLPTHCRVPCVANARNASLVDGANIGLEHRDENRTVDIISVDCLGLQDADHVVFQTK
jgi:hypothetical protein